MGKSRQAGHQALIDWRLIQVDTRAADAVLMAGDIFDTGAPPSHARELQPAGGAAASRGGGAAGQIVLLPLRGGHPV